MDKNTGIIVCSARNCYNRDDLSPKKIFFRFPAEPERAKAWASSCGRNDLLDKADTLHEDHRLCADHFENRMYTDILRDHLKQDAQPTVFPSLETYINTDDHDYACASEIQIKEYKPKSRLPQEDTNFSDSDSVIEIEHEDIEKTDLIDSKIFKHSGEQSANSDDKSLKKIDFGILENLSSKTHKDTSIQNTGVKPNQKIPVVTTTSNRRKHAKVPVTTLPAKQRCQTIMPAMPVVQSPQSIIIVSQGIQKVIPIIQNTQAGLPTVQNNISTAQNLQKVALKTSGSHKIAPAALSVAQNPQTKWPVVHVTPSGEKVVQSVPLHNSQQIVSVPSISHVQTVASVSQKSQAKWPFVHQSPSGKKVVQSVPIVVVNDSSPPPENAEAHPICVQCRTCGEIFKKESCTKLSDTLPHRPETLLDLLSKCVPSICPGLSDVEYICPGCKHLLTICVAFIERCISVDKDLRTIKLKVNISGMEQVEDCKELSDNESAEQLSISSSITANKAGPDNIHSKFQCEYCNKKFVYFKTYTCHTRNKLCVRRKERKLKKRRAQREAQRRERKEKERQEREMEEKLGKTAYLCDICGKTFSKKCYLDSHSRLHVRCNARAVCYVCGKTTAAQHLKQHMRVMHGPKGERLKQFMCDQCPRLFSTIYSLQAHRDYVHEKIEKHKCHECNKSFATRNGLKLHNGTRHSNERPYKCTACNVTFVRKNYYRRHFHTIYHKVNTDPSYKPKKKSPRATGHRHNIGRPCICKYCNKVLKNEYSLKTHYYSHLNYRPFKCSYCHLRFKRQAPRDKHQKVHQEPDAHLRCDVCFRKYPDEEKLRAHRSSHKMRFVCELCNEGFGRKFLIDNHMAEKHSDNNEQEQIHEILSEGIQYADQEDDVKLDTENGVVVEQLESVYSDEDYLDNSKSEEDQTDFLESEDFMQFVERSSVESEEEPP